MDVRVDIQRDRTAPVVARCAVDRLRDRLDPEIVPDLKLLVSEVTTNAVKYGDGDVAVHLQTDHPRHVMVEVRDQGDGFRPLARTRPPTEVGGWGLHLVDRLSARWGVRDGSTIVWFEIDRR